MKEAKFYISSAVFLALTAVRMLSPAAADRVADGLAAAMSLEQEHTAAVVQLGRSIADGDAIQTFMQHFESPEPSPTPSPTPTPTPTPEPMPTPTPEPTQNPAVTAFLESQEAYSAYAVPADVSYERPELPFEYINPVTGVTSSGFGYRLHPIKNEVKYHYGTDLAADTGTQIHAFADGTIVAQGNSDSFGKYVMIDHAGGYRTLYAHCSQLCMSCGSVSRGDVIALVGATGEATGPHLHFELERDGVYLNPEFYI